MKLHANAPFGPKGKLTMVRRVIEQGWSLTEAAEAAVEEVAVAGLAADREVIARAAVHPRGAAVAAGVEDVDSVEDIIPGPTFQGVAAPAPVAPRIAGGPAWHYQMSNSNSGFRYIRGDGGRHRRKSGGQRRFVTGASRLGVVVRMVLAVVAVAILSMTASASASALNLTGTWQANYHCETGCAGQNFPAKDVLTQAEGSEEVTGSNEGESISGTLTGNTFKFQSKAGAYSTEATLTISADGNSWSGPLHDSHGTSGTYTATRRRVAAIQVNCTAFHPGLPNEYFECTAQLGDASGQSPVQIPTGTVAFAVNPGGGGSIYGPKSCTLAASQSGGASSFCAVDYLPPAVGIPLGSEPPLTATYSGDSAFAMTSGQPKNSISSGNPLTPRSVYESLCQDIFTPACEGVVPPPALFSDVCFSLTGCGAGEHGSGSGEETVDISPDEHSLVADVSCPAPSGQLTSCELQAYLEGMDLDPTVKAKLEYELNYAEYLKQLAIERAGIVSETQKFVAALPVEGTPAEQKEAEERHNKVSAQITDQINGLYDALAKRGTPIPPGFEPVDTAAVSKFCESSASQKDCLAFWAAIGEVLKASSDKLSSTKATLGVNVPFKPPAKAQSSSISTVIFDKATKRGPHKMVFATSKNVTVPAGKKAKVKLSLPPFVRARLKDALGNGVRTVKADMVVQIATSAGDSTLRTVPVKLKLVAKKKHH